MISTLESLLSDLSPCVKYPGPPSSVDVPVSPVLLAEFSSPCRLPCPTVPFWLLVASSSGKRLSVGEEALNWGLGHRVPSPVPPLQGWVPTLGGPVSPCVH